MQGLQSLDQKLAKQIVKMDGEHYNKEKILFAQVTSYVLSYFFSLLISV